MNKFLGISILFTMFFHIVQAQENEINVPTKLAEVTVSLNGATLKREASVTLKPGINTLKITGLSASMTENSLQAGLGDEAKIVSVSVMKDFVTDAKKTRKTEQLSDSLESLNLKARILKLDSNAISIEKQILTENINRIGKDGVSVTELQTTLPYYRTQLKQIHEKQISNENALQTIRAAIKKTNAQLQVIQEETLYNTNTLYITVNAVAAAKSKLTIAYVSTQAAWLPQYDIRTKGAGSPIVFDYRAKIVNRTGEDWEKVVLKLTTADPSQLMQKPVLEVWGLNYNNHSNNEGILNTYQMKANTWNKDEDKRVYDLNPLQKQTAVEVNEVSAEFQIKDISTIMSDGIAQTIDVNTFEFPATYQYYCIPKLDKDVFLMGKITNWESMNLTEGEASVYIDNNYVGKSLIDFKTANDTLELFLGIDKKVIVNRVKKKDDGSQKTIGLNRKESFIYNINIRNTNNVPVNIQVIDQIPVAQESDIEVTANEISGATLDALSGRLNWFLTIAPADTKKLVLDFTVKYPRNKKVNIRRSRQVLSPSNFW